MGTISYKSSRQKNSGISKFRNRTVDVKKEYSEKKLHYYTDNLKFALNGWQPKVFILNCFVKDLRAELKRLPIPNSGNLLLVDYLIARDVDYVTDSEYINCIKFILEKWCPELLFKEKYIRYVYDGLKLEYEPYENEMGFVEDSRLINESAAMVS